MSRGWVLRIAGDGRRDLSEPGAPLRLATGVEAATDGSSLWLRGGAWEPELQRDLAGARYLRFDDLGDGNLAPPGAAVPTERIPALDWQPIAAVIPVALETASAAAPPLPALLPAPAAIGLARSSRERPAAALWTSVRAFASWAEDAPAARLQPLSFAVRRARGVASSEQGQALIHGAPLPPLPGTPLWEDAAILIPCGQELSPAVPGAEARKLLDQGCGEHARFLFLPDGSMHGIRVEDFAVATRATIRATCQRLEIDPR